MTTKSDAKRSLRKRLKAAFSLLIDADHAMQRNCEMTEGQRVGHQDGASDYHHETKCDFDGNMKIDDLPTASRIVIEVEARAAKAYHTHILIPLSHSPGEAI